MTMTHCLASLLQDTSRQTMRTPGRETIHSGQFMVSDFEAEAKEDDDAEIQMPDPDDSAEADKLIEKSTCMALQLYQPRNVAVPSNRNSNQFQIDTSLAKLMKCISLSYKQKLTSPKWNHFKGIRLMWKDKIRLNNLIWRCWHMQFIMKVKTVVCQFASPLDVDIHNKPEAVILEGKYWKRQLDVIKAEYMKWRKYNRSRIQCAPDSISDLHYIAWSPATCLMLQNECNDYSDTLFSSLSGACYFPDTREINRSTNADYIQPSLEALQPNLEEYSFQDLITKLAPVPEEFDLAIEDRQGEFSYPAIMGSEQMDTSTVGGVISDDNVQHQEIPQTLANSIQNNTNNVMRANINYDKMFGQNVNTSNEMERLIGGQSSMEMAVDPFCSLSNQSNMPNNYGVMNQFGIGNDNIMTNSILKPSHFNKEQRSGRQQGRNFPRRNRDVPNYVSKVEPTVHQTNIYNQIIAQQQPSQLDLFNSTTFDNSNMINNANISPSHQTNSFPNALNLTTDTNSSIHQINNNYNVQNNQNLHGIHLNNLNLMNSVRESISDPMGMQQTINELGDNMANVSPNMQLQSYKALPSHHSNSHSYNPYPQQIYKMNSTNSGYQQNSGSMHPHSLQGQVHIPDQLTAAMNQVSSSGQLSIDKEKYRSHSLPLNTSLPINIGAIDQTQLINPSSMMTEDNFAVPKYNTYKGSKSKSRSNSALMKQHSQPQLSSINFSSIQSTTSEPMLNSPLTSLLTNAKPTMEIKQTESTAAMLNLRKLQNEIDPYGTQFKQQTEIDETQPPSGKKMRSASTEQRHSPKFSNSLVASPDSGDSEMNASPKRTSSSYSHVSSTRRSGHNQSEKNRRCNIKHGFDMLDTLIPQLQQNPNAKLSKAAKLQKGAEYIRSLQNQRAETMKRIDELTKERDTLNTSLNMVQSMLPANGAPVVRQRTGRLQELYDQYVQFQAERGNWKFWILGLIFEPLFSTFNATVSVASFEELNRTAMLWVEQNCTLSDLRPAVTTKLRYLSQITDILSEPPTPLQDEVMKAIAQKRNTTKSSTQQKPSYNNSY